MGVRSLASLSASDAQLETFAQSMWDRLEPIGPHGPAITRDTWRERLGDRSAYGEYQRYFVDDVTRAGIDATLRDALPTLMPGIAAAAFHCVIRTGYGVRFGKKYCGNSNLACNAARMPTTINPNHSGEAR